MTDIEIHKNISEYSVSFGIFGKIYVNNEFRRPGVASSEFIININLKMRILIQTMKLGFILID